MHEPRNHDEAVHHLLALGYFDPDAVIAREAALRRQLEAEFQAALKSYERGDTDDAQRRSERLIVDDPAWIAPRQLLAEIYYRSQCWEQARSQLEWLTLHAVEHPRLALIAGAMSLADRDFPAAISSLKYASHVDPLLPSVHTLLGNAYLRLGSVDQAEGAFETALTHNSADGKALDGLAAVCIRRRDFAGAADFALQALDADIQLFTAHYRLGIALAQLGRVQEAMVALETSVRLNTLAAAPYYWLERLAGQQLADTARASQYRKLRRDAIHRRRQLAINQNATSDAD